MKKTLKNSAILSMALLSLGSTASVFAAGEDGKTTEPSNALSHGKIKFLENTNPTGPVDPTDPDGNHPNGNDPDGPTDPEDPNNPNPGTDNPGPLSLDNVTNLTFGTVNINTDGVKEFWAQQNTPFVQVTDSREKGNWYLTAQITKQFTKTDTVDGKEAVTGVLSGAKLHWKNGEVLSTNTDKNADGLARPLLSSADISLENGKLVQFMSNEKEFEGKGTWVARFSHADAKNDENKEGEDLGTNENMTLEVPANVATAGEYSADISWSLTDAPQA